MRLINLIAMGLAGYAVYELLRPILPRTGRRMDGRSPSPAQVAETRRARLSGESGEGMRVEVADTDGGTHQQIAGRGVIRS